MFIRLHRHPDAILVVEFAERQSNSCEIDYNYHFLWTRPASIDDEKGEGMSVDAPRMYLKAMAMVEFNPFLVTHDSGTKVDIQELSERIIGKRKSGKCLFCKQLRVCALPTNNGQFNILICRGQGGGSI